MNGADKDQKKHAGLGARQLSIIARTTLRRPRAKLVLLMLLLVLLMLVLVLLMLLLLFRAEGLRFSELNRGLLLFSEPSQGLLLFSEPSREVAVAGTVHMVLHSNLQSSHLATRIQGLQSKSSKNKPNVTSVQNRSRENRRSTPAESRAGQKKAHQNHAKPCNTMQKLSKIVSCQNQAMRKNRTSCSSSPYMHAHSKSSFQRKTVRNKLPAMPADQKKLSP